MKPTINHQPSLSIYSPSTTQSLTIFILQPLSIYMSLLIYELLITIIVNGWQICFLWVHPNPLRRFRLSRTELPRALGAQTELQGGEPLPLRGWDELMDVDGEASDGW